MGNTTATSGKRTIDRLIEGIPVSEGAGVRLKRLIGTFRLPNLDPFLMLDEFCSDSAEDYGAGFPDHPHRGFQTVTYLLAGRMRHRDNQGRSGLLRSGGVQWMNAGRGIIHSEMPEQEEGLMWGFQLWVNLPAHEKMSEPAYQEFDPEQIPESRPDRGVSVKVIAGRTEDGTEGAVRNIVTQPLFLDVVLHESDARFTQSLPGEHTAFLYVYDGEVTVDNRLIREGQLVLLSQGPAVEVQNGPANAGFLLVAGAPIREPIVQRGPFVMTTRQEVQQAFEDYLNGRF
jgi:redox-sensitive bicupin YhaK (pirin superfamily)